MAISKPITVVSLFDGISMSQLALRRAGIPVSKYYSSEIDPDALRVTNHHFPDTVQLGDVRNVVASMIPEPVDLMVSGSPCQDLSSSGLGQGLGGERSGLFYEFVRLKNALKPKYFLMENVASMSDENRDIISRVLGVQPICINSSLVSAQNRERYYWTNIPNVTQPEDRGITLDQIITDGYVSRSKSYCIDASYYKGGNLRQYFEKSRRQLVVALDPTDRVEKRGDILQKFTLEKAGGRLLRKNMLPKGEFTQNHYAYRMLSPLELERLQTVDENYTAILSDSKRCFALGNGFTVDVISHIMSFMEI